MLVLCRFVTFKSIKENNFNSTKNDSVKRGIQVNSLQKSLFTKIYLRFGLKILVRRL